jgi:hypothetical protein
VLVAQSGCLGHSFSGCHKKFGPFTQHLHCRKDSICRPVKAKSAGLDFVFPLHGLDLFHLECRRHDLLRKYGIVLSLVLHNEVLSCYRSRKWNCMSIGVSNSLFNILLERTETVAAANSNLRIVILFNGASLDFPNRNEQ